MGRRTIGYAWRSKAVSVRLRKKAGRWERSCTNALRAKTCHTASRLAYRRVRCEIRRGARWRSSPCHDEFSVAPRCTRPRPRTPGGARSNGARPVRPFAWGPEKPTGARQGARDYRVRNRGMVRITEETSVGRGAGAERCVTGRGAMVRRVAFAKIVSSQVITPAQCGIWHCATSEGKSKTDKPCSRQRL